MTDTGHNRLAVLASDLGAAAMSAIGDKTALQAGVEAVTLEAAGMMEVAVIRPSDLLNLMSEALAESDDATLLLRLYGDTAARVDMAPASKRLLCVSCPRELQRGYSVAAALPCRDNPNQAVALAVCPRCGSDRETIQAKAMEGFQRIWPDLRVATVTRPQGGRA